MSSSEHRRSWYARVRELVARRREGTPSSPLWRIGAPAVFVVAGALFVTSAVSSGGTDLSGTAGRVGDLAGLASSEADELEALRARHAELAGEVDRLTRDLSRTSASSVQSTVDKLRGPAGLDTVSGAGLTITLSDAPESVADTIGDNEINDLVVHQQDIQAVANALWEGGAEAMTIQDQRVISTTGIRCVGNSVVLHDVPYAPPYRISAVGPVTGMLDALNSSPFVGFYLEAVARWQLGWDVTVEPRLELPGYDGSTELDYARAAGGLATRSDDGT
jgi:uncharacterized protein YlxW (UPF0749 family)